MAQNENVLWSILNFLRGNRNGWVIETKDKEPEEHYFDDAYPVGKLKGELVLTYRPDDIEDTIYFMKHREYIKTHGQGTFSPEIVYSLTEKGCSVADKKELPKEEEQAFQEALWDIKPKLWGMGPNVPEWIKRAKKLARGKSSDEDA